MASTIVISVLCGFGVGILSGLLGVGGGTVIIPILRLGFGLDGLVATGTSLFSIFFTSLSGTVGRIRTKTVNIKAGLVVGIGGVVFSPLGSWLSELAGGTAAMIAAAVVIAYTGIHMIFKGIKVTGTSPSSDALSDGGSKGSRFAGARSLEMSTRNASKLLAVGAVGGLASGFIGVGGGFIIVPMLMWIFKLSMKDASGTSLMALCLLTIPGFIAHGFYGNVDWIKGIALAAGSIPGAQLGTALVKRVPERILRILFGILLLVASTSLVLKELF